jgi:hypothetical protein
MGATEKPTRKDRRRMLPIEPSDLLKSLGNSNKVVAVLQTIETFRPLINSTLASHGPGTSVDLRQLAEVSDCGET